MSALTVAQALDHVYASLLDDNRDIDLHIAALKAALSAAGQRQVVADAQRLAQSNRQGRKMMQAYFKKRGVDVVFAGE